jgi:peptidoglycan/LPS O-acetylase OafA/YrhL
MPCFVSGVIAFIFFKKKNINYFYLITYLFLGFLFIPIFTGVFNVPQNLSCILFTFPLGFLIAYSKEIKSNAINIVCNKIAKYSYGIYLFQGLAIDIIFNYSNLLLPIIFKITLAILLTILFAYAVYKFIEKPFIKFYTLRRVGGDVTDGRALKILTRVTSFYITLTSFFYERMKRSNLKRYLQGLKGSSFHWFLI